MASTTDAHADALPTSGIHLEFARLPGSTIFDVTLPSGERVRATRNRERVFPGLGTLGPSTNALYELAIEELGAEALAGTILDLGAGCGLGAQQLLEAGAAVIAVDADATACKVAVFFAAKATVIHAPIESVVLDALADGAVFIDVLGFLESPLGTLRAARKLLRPGARIVVAEPLAYPAQVLIPPARRATSPAELALFLESAGFALLRCAADGGVVVASGVAIEDASVDSLVRGANHCGSGDLVAALKLFDVVAGEGKRSLAVQAALDSVDVLVAQGRGDDACSRLLAILRRFPDEPRPLAALSQFMVAASEYTEAQQLAEKASRLAPLDPGVLVALAIALDSTRSPDAPAAWRRAFNLTPQSMEVALPAATSAMEHAFPLLAERILLRSMEYAGNTLANAYILRARVRMALGRNEDASLDARLAVASDPQSPVARALLAALEAA